MNEKVLDKIEQTIPLLQEVRKNLLEALALAEREAERTDLSGDERDEVKKGLASLMADRTVIEIAHKASALQDADHVIVLDEGRVTASGTIVEVEKENAFFRQLMQV